MKPNDPAIKAIVQATFPHTKKDVKIVEFKGPKSVDSYWTDGSRELYYLYCLETQRCVGLPTGVDKTSLTIETLNLNMCLVEGGTFMGKPKGLRIYFRPENLPAPKEALSEQAQKALKIISTMKSGYRLQEFHRESLGVYHWTLPCIQELATRGLVKINAVGSIAVTIEGRNNVQS